MDWQTLLTISVSLLGALQLATLYSAWLSRKKLYAEAHKTTAEARKTTEEAETEDAKQKGTEVDNLRAIAAEWEKQYGLLVKRVDELRTDLDQEKARRKGVENSAAERIADLEQRFANEQVARIEADKRASAQAQHIITLQQKIESLEDENAQLRAEMASQQETMESLHATISSLQLLNEKKDQQIAKLRADLQDMELRLGCAEVQEKVAAAERKIKERQP